MSALLKVNSDIERVCDARGLLLALIVRNDFNRPGVTFLTDPSFSQQLAFIKHAAAHKINRHIHKPIMRSVCYTQETLIIKRGKLRANFYDGEQNYISSTELGPGDVALLICGGHGFEVLDDVEMIEVKQGPYADDQDKVLF